MTQKYRLTASTVASFFKQRCDRLFRWNTVESRYRGRAGIGWNVPVTRPVILIQLVVMSMIIAYATYSLNVLAESDEALQSHSAYLPVVLIGEEKQDVTPTPINSTPTTPATPSNTPTATNTTTPTPGSTVFPEYYPYDQNGFREGCEFIETSGNPEASLVGVYMYRSIIDLIPDTPWKFGMVFAEGLDPESGVFFYIYDPHVDPPQLTIDEDLVTEVWVFNDNPDTFDPENPFQNLRKLPYIQKPSEMFFDLSSMTYRTNNSNETPIEANIWFGCDPDIYVIPENSSP